jgi:glutathione S-transferase
MMRILGRADSANVQKVTWCAAELGLAYQREDFGGKFAGTREPAYLALNPNGLVPTLVEGDFVLWESNTIVRYLAARAGRLIPADARARALVERWMDWQLSVVLPPHIPLFVGLVRTPPAQRDWDKIRAGRDKTAAAFTILDAALANTRWVGGDEFSVADIVLGPFVYRWFEMDIQREDLPRLARWYNQLRERPHFNELVAIGIS